MKKLTLIYLLHGINQEFPQRLNDSFNNLTPDAKNFYKNEVNFLIIYSNSSDYTYTTKKLESIFTNKYRFNKFNLIYSESIRNFKILNNIEEINSEYLFIIDADDSILANNINKIIPALNSNIDIIRIKYRSNYFIYQNRITHNDNKQIDELGIYSFSVGQTFIKTKFLKNFWKKYNYTLNQQNEWFSFHEWLLDSFAYFQIPNPTFFLVDTFFYLKTRFVLPNGEHKKNYQTREVFKKNLWSEIPAQNKDGEFKFYYQSKIEILKLMNTFLENRAISKNDIDVIVICLTQQPWFYYKNHNVKAGLFYLKFNNINSLEDIKKYTNFLKKQISQLSDSEKLKYNNLIKEYNKFLFYTNKIPDYNKFNKFPKNENNITDIFEAFKTLMKPLERISKYQLKNKQAITFETFNLFNIGHKRLIRRIKRKTNKKVIVGASSNVWSDLKDKKTIELEKKRRKKVANYKYIKKVFFKDHPLDVELWDKWAYENNADIIILGSNLKNKIPLNKIITPVYFISRTPFILTTLLRKWKIKRNY